MSEQTLLSRIAHTYLLRLADQTPDLTEELLEELGKDESERLFSPKARQLLRRAFGRMGLSFFDFYMLLYRIRAGWPLPEDGLRAEFMPAYRMVYRQLEGEEAKNQVGEFFARMKPWLNKIEAGTAGLNIWKDVIENYVQVMTDLAIDKDVWLVTKRRSEGGLPWMSLWVMPKKQQRLERIKRDDPELFRTLMQSEETRERLKGAISRRIAEGGLVPGEEYVVISGKRTSGGKLKGYGRPVQTGTDKLGNVSYFDEDGNRYTRDEYIAQARERMEALKGLRRVTISERDLDDLRVLPRDVMLQMEDKPVKYKALTDDPNKSSSLTRIYPVVEISGLVRDEETGALVNRTTEVVASGRYAGIALPDLVNRAGRQIEGSVYDYDETTARPVKIEVKNPDGTPNIRVLREPYVTTYKGKLFLKIPVQNKARGERGEFDLGTTPMRRAIRKLSKSIPSVKYLEDGQNATFTFDPKDFGAIRTALGGMAMSNDAMKMVKAHFEAMAKAEMATADENLKYYTNEALGGFGEDTDPLTVKQKQALAWLDANGNKGVCALDTGMGKTATSIAIMQKLKRDGLMDDPDAGNGRYLYVCPTALKGNLAKELEKWLVDPGAMIDRVDVMSYDEFRRARGKMVKKKVTDRGSRSFGKMREQWEPTSFGEDYIAVFFDEAQALKNPGSQRSMAAASLNHPRKVLLTASPMERSPMEVYALQAISNNVDLTKSAERKKMAEFKKQFAESVGGRVVGVRSDNPDILREFRVWVKQNLYFADKQDPQAVALPDLKTDGGTPVQMTPEIEQQYRAIAKSIAKRLAQVARSFKGRLRKKRDEETAEDYAAYKESVLSRARQLAVESLRAGKTGLSREFGELTRLSNIPNWEFEDVPAPTAKNPDATKRVWTRIPGLPNPKVDLAVSKVEERIETGNKTLLFTDSPQMATESGIRMSEQFPRATHLVGYSNKIEVFRGGEVVHTYTPRAYPNFVTGEDYDRSEWKVPVLQSLMRGVDPTNETKKVVIPATATLTGSYAVGQNLQMFSTVVHLDRDTWNAETMKQRTARAWRSGQNKNVEEYTLDMAYSETRQKTDETLDETRKAIQEMDSRLFDEVVVQSQSQDLGVEWLTMKRNESELHEVNRQMIEMAMSPYLARMGEEER